MFDPEIPVDIYELGLIYKVDVSDEQGRGHRHDPDRAGLPGGRRDARLGARRGAGDPRGHRSCKVDLVFDPPWDPSLMSDEAKLELNMF